MLELHLALHSRSLDPATDRTPTIIPVLWDSGLSEWVDEVEEFWKLQLESGSWLTEEQRPWVDPAQWRSNVASMISSLQALRRTGSNQKGEWRDLAKRVHEAVVLEMPSNETVDGVGGCVFGTQAQQKALMEQLRIEPQREPETRALWLHGVGAVRCSCMALQPL